MTASRETSSATTGLVLAYVREHLGDQGVQQVVAAAGVRYPACLYAVTWARRSRWRRRAEIDGP